MDDRLHEWVGASEAARIAGVSRPRIHQLCRMNVLDGTHIAGRLVVHRRGLDIWRRSREVRSCWKPATLDELRCKRDEILALAAAHGARNVRVFGSVPRGDATPDSDLDLAVDLDEGRNVLDVAALIVDVEDAVGRPVDLITTRSPRAAQILEDAVPL